MKKKHKIIILPTKDITNLVKSTSRYGGLFESKYYTPMKEMGDSYQHLYIISDDKIEKNDWFNHKTDATNTVHKCILIEGKFGIIGNDIINYFRNNCRKIISSTDISLDLPIILQFSTQEYIKSNENIKEIEVEYEEKGNYYTDNYDLPLFISNLKLKTTSDNEIIINSIEEEQRFGNYIKPLFEKKEKLYTLEEVKEISHKAYKERSDYDLGNQNRKEYVEFNNWFNSQNF